MTEEEAKAKWCPFARMAAGVGGRVALDHPAYNRYAEEGDAAGQAVGACIGTACMAWRWTKIPSPERRMKLPATGGGQVDFKAREAMPGDGYCGLAGQQPAVPAA